jgi:hypothetical protein
VESSGSRRGFTITSFAVVLNIFTSRTADSSRCNCSASESVLLMKSDGGNPREKSSGFEVSITTFVAGNDSAARQTAASLAADLGWTDVFDLVDLTASRGLEMYLPLWVRMFSLIGRPHFNIKVVR